MVFIYLFFVYFFLLFCEQTDATIEDLIKNLLGGQLGQRPEQPPAILDSCWGCLGLRPRPPPFCMKSAGAAEAWGAVQAFDTG